MGYFEWNKRLYSLSINRYWSFLKCHLWEFLAEEAHVVFGFMDSPHQNHLMRWKKYWAAITSMLSSVFTCDPDEIIFTFLVHVPVKRISAHIFLPEWCTTIWSHRESNNVWIKQTKIITGEHHDHQMKWKCLKAGMVWESSSNEMSETCKVKCQEVMSDGS